MSRGARPGARHRPWSSAELELLSLRLAEKVPKAQIAAELGRSKSAIEVAAWKLRHNPARPLELKRREGARRRSAAEVLDVFLRKPSGEARQ